MLYGQYKNVLKQDAYRIESPTTDLSYILYTIPNKNLDGISCGNIADKVFENIATELGKYKNSNIGVVVVDFGEVTHIGTAFLRKYIKYCLTVKPKILNINMSANVELIYSQCIQEYINAIN